MLPEIVTLGIFLGVMIAIGAWLRKRIKLVEDFTVAGRKLGLLLVTFTIASTYMGGGTVIGYTGSAFATGVSIIWWFIIGVIFGMIILGIGIAKKLRRLGGMTLPDVYTMRYGVPPTLIVGIIVVLLSIFVVAVQLRATGVILTTFLKVPMETGMIIATIITLAYTILAGMWSLAVMDLLFGLLIWPGVLIAAPIAVMAAGGFGGLATLPPAHFSLVGYIPITTGIPFILLTWFLILGDASVYQKISSSKDEKTAKLSCFLALALMLTVYVCVTLVGMSARVLFPGIPKDLAFPEVVIKLMPYGLSLFFITSLMAVTMSTSDSFLLIGSTATIRDIYHKSIKPIGDKAQIIGMRLLMIIYGVISLCIAWLAPGIIDLLIHAYMLGTVLFVPIGAGFYWRRASSSGAIMSVAAGTVTYLTWHILKSPMGIHPVVTGLTASVLALIITSYLTAPPKQEVIKLFFES